MKISKTSIFYRITRNAKVMVGIVIVTLTVLMAILAPVISPYDPYDISLGKPLESPNSTFLFGTDTIGRDVLTRIIYGSRISLIAAVSVGFSSAILGVIFGLISGYIGGKTDLVIMRVVDIMLSIPGIVAALVVAAIFNPSLFTVIIALTFGMTSGFVRVIRSKTLALKEETYVRAAESIGESKLFIMFRYILPNTLGIVFIQIALNMSNTVIFEAGISYLGLGSQPPSTSWGLMLSEASKRLFNAPQTFAIIPGLFILVLVLGLNFLGDGLRDIYDPRLR
jgi:peptide/nickel transport system permease protein